MVAQHSSPHLSTQRFDATVTISGRPFTFRVSARRLTLGSYGTVHYDWMALPQFHRAADRLGGRADELPQLHRPLDAGYGRQRPGRRRLPTGASLSLSTAPA